MNITLPDGTDYAVIRWYDHDRRWECSALVFDKWYKGYGATLPEANAELERKVAAKLHFGVPVPTSWKKEPALPKGLDIGSLDL